MDLSWMAWSTPTALFFIFIAVVLTAMGVLHVFAPSRARVGVLGVSTRRGDRLFIALLGSAYIHLGWLAFTDVTLWGATGLSVVFAGLVFRFA